MNSDNRRLPWRSCFCATFIALLLSCGTTAALLAQEPEEATHGIFELNGELIFELAGQEPGQATIYVAERTGAILIIAPEPASPLLLNTQTNTVESLLPTQVVKSGEGAAVELEAGATGTQVSEFQVEGTEVLFHVGDQQARLRLKPPILGLVEVETVKSLRPKYGRLADEYSPSAADIEALRTQKVRVRALTYFGTWCPICMRLLPKMIRVADELRGSEIRFAFHGLPPPPQIEEVPAVERDDIRALPTTIVFIDDKEVGRFGARELNDPEAALRQLLGTVDPRAQQ